MLLAIDCGNTHIVAGVYDGDYRLCQWRAATVPSRTADEYAALLSQWLSLEGIGGSEVTHVIIATVVPGTQAELCDLALRTFGCEPLVVGERGAILGIELLLDRPEDVGADRLVNAVAAHSVYGGPAVVLDFGTATTFDVVDRDGNYCGGVIAPGVHLGLEALHAATARLPRIAVKRPATAIGRDTVSAMQSGIYWGYVGLIEGITQRLLAEVEGKHKVVATGGLSHLFAGGTDAIDLVDPDLTLRGLLEIWKRNQP